MQEDARTAALRTWLGTRLGGFGWTLQPASEDASFRRYFRIRFADARVSLVVMDAPPDKEDCRPFLHVSQLFSAAGAHVPVVHAADPELGFLLLEDLGDDTLANYLAAHPGRREALYVRAVTDLARAQEALTELPAGSVVSTRAFDEDLLHWEIDHFREWALEARGVTLAAEDRATFEGIARRLARAIAGWPRTFVHRDYQSRNLMVRPGEGLCWIDFQDALLGPRIYDLVALLNDSYQTFDPAFVAARLDDYARARGLDAAGRAAIGREFDLVTVQRKLKDAGRFVFIDRVKKNPSFLRFVDPTIAKVRKSLARLEDEPDMKALAALLARVLP